MKKTVNVKDKRELPAFYIICEIYYISQLTFD